MQIKNRYIIIAIVVLLILAFSAGAFTVNYNAKARISEYAERIDSLEGELDTQGKLLSTITEELNSTTVALGKAKDTITGLEESNQLITDENRKSFEIIRDLREGTSTDIEGLSIIIERLDGYLE